MRSIINFLQQERRINLKEEEVGGGERERERKFWNLALMRTRDWKGVWSPWLHARWSLSGPIVSAFAPLCVCPFLLFSAFVTVHCYGIYSISFPATLWDGVSQIKCWIPISVESESFPTQPWTCHECAGGCPISVGAKIVPKKQQLSRYLL